MNTRELVFRFSAITSIKSHPLLIQVTKSVISLLMYYGWKKFSIIYEEPWTTVANSLKDQATLKNMTINHFEQMFDNHKCCENMLQCCQSGYWYQVSSAVASLNCESVS